MKELMFIVTEEADGGGYVARAVGQSIFTQADTGDELERNIREAVRTHFDGEEQLPEVLHLHIVRDKTIPLSTSGRKRTDDESLRGSLIAYENPFGPACPEQDWDALR